MPSRENTPQTSLEKSENESPYEKEKSNSSQTSFGSQSKWKCCWRGKSIFIDKDKTGSSYKENEFADPPSMPIKNDTMLMGREICISGRGNRVAPMVEQVDS